MSTADVPRKESEAVMDEERLKTGDGLEISVRSWRPTQARGVLVIVPGFNSHSGYYVAAAETFAARGLAVLAVDLRGRGKSDGERFYVQKFADYVGDVAMVVGKAKAELPGLPVFLLGHSAGGVVACLYARDHQAELAGLISESSAFQVPAPDFALALFKGLSHVAPHARVLHLNNAFFSRDKAVVAAMDADPLIAHEKQPTQTLAELVRAAERLRTAFPAMTLPLLIIHGTADKATKPSGSRFFFDKAGSGDKTLKLYDGVFHDPLNDLGRETVMADIQAWLDAHLPGG